MLLNDLINDGWTIRLWPYGCLQLTYRRTDLSVVGPYDGGPVTPDRPDARHCFLISGPASMLPMVSESFGPALSKNGRWVHFTDSELTLLKLAGNT